MLQTFKPQTTARDRKRIEYRKIPKISPKAYIFQRPLFEGLIFGGVIYGGAYLGREICASKSIGLSI